MVLNISLGATGLYIDNIFSSIYSILYIGDINTLDLLNIISI